MYGSITPHLQYWLPHAFSGRKLCSCAQLIGPQLLLQCRQLLHYWPVFELQLLLTLTVLLELHERIGV
jgi:hypothetical protein